MPYPAIAFISVLLFSAVHLFAGGLRRLSPQFQSRFLSIGGGIAIAYIFVDLMPKIGANQRLVDTWVYGFFPYFERHVYVVALVGFLLFFLVDRLPVQTRPKSSLWLSIGAYALLNFLVGYSVVDKDDPDVQPLALFTVAIALHDFANDYALVKNHGELYGHVEKWVLVASLFFGWTVGFFYILPKVAIAVISAFIGGGVMMNVIRHELPEDNPNNSTAFLLSCALYTFLLLSI